MLQYPEGSPTLQPLSEATNPPSRTFVMEKTAVFERMSKDTVLHCTQTLKVPQRFHSSVSPVSVGERVKYTLWAATIRGHFTLPCLNFWFPLIRFVGEKNVLRLKKPYMRTLYL